MAILLFLYWRTAPAELLSASPEFRNREWTRNCLWYVLLAFLMSWLFRLSLVVLKTEQIAGIEIARFAAALETASLILVVAKSTNKFYQPEVSMIMSNRDWVSGNRLSRQRIFLIGSICLGYFAAMIVFGRQIPGWFGEDFEVGYLSLCFMSVGTCTATAFSLAPEYLKFSGRLKTVLFVNCVAGVLLVVLTLVLAAMYGVTGAGLAFGMVITASAVVFRLIAGRQISRESGSADSVF